MKTASEKAGDEGRRSLAPLRLEVLEGLRGRFHADCLACGDPMYRLNFEYGAEGELVTRFQPGAGHCSYRGVVHGGVIGMLIDEAMTCCLMAHGVVAVTGELKLRYLETVEVAGIELRTRVTRAFAPLYHLACELSQGSEVRVWGHGRFLQRPAETRKRDQ